MFRATNEKFERIHFLHRNNFCYLFSKHNYFVVIKYYFTGKHNVEGYA